MYLLFSTHLVIKNNQFKTLPYETRKEIIFKDLSLSNVLEKLRQSNISIRAIYNNPTPENCQKIIDLLVPSEQYGIKQLFEYTAEPLTEERGNYSQLENQYSYMVRNSQGSDSCFEAILSQTCQQQHKMGDFHQIAPKLLNYIKILENRFEVTKKLLHEPKKPLILASEDLDLVENPMPIILCYNQNHDIRIFSMQSQEYRAQKALKLGKDIQTIATDTEANIKRLQAYSNRHQLNLNIISFADLKRANRFLTTENPLPSQHVMSRPPAIKKLNDFCSQQEVRFNDNSVLNSLVRFQEKAKELILSDLSVVEKRTQLKACAHDEFKHRDNVPRLLADALMLISSLALVGLVIGVTRVLSGHSFFFSSEKTRREAEFIEVADVMELGCER